MERVIEPVPTATGGFPPGTRLFDVNGLPVCWLPRPSGGFTCQSWATREPQPFSAIRTFHAGKLIGPGTFDALREACLERGEDIALTRFLLLTKEQRRAVPLRESAPRYAFAMCLNLRARTDDHFDEATHSAALELASAAIRRARRGFTA